MSVWGLDKDILGGSAGRDKGHDVVGVGDNDIENVGSVVVDHFADGVTELFLFDNAAALDSESLADGGPVWIETLDVLGATDVVRMAEDSLSADTLIKDVFPLDNHTEVLVVHDHDLDRDVFHDGGGELLDIHHEGAVPIDIDDGAFRAGHLGTEGGRQAKSHGSEAE